MPVDETKVWIRSRRLRNGKSSHHLRWIDPTTRKWRNRRIGTDRKIAEREALRLEDQLANGEYRDMKRIAWADFVKDHVEKIEGARDATEAKRTLEEFGEMMNPASPKRVTYTMIESYVSKLRKENENAPATINKKLRYLRAALNRAVRRGFAARSPVDSGLFQAEEQNFVRVASDEEETALLDKAETMFGLQMRTFIYTALRTGGRREELLRLTWERIVLDGDEPRLDFVNTKSHRSRTVPLNEDVVDVLRRLKVQTQQAGGPFVGMGETLSRRWGRLRKKAGAKDITIHDLRRTFVTRLIRAGVPLPTVQRLAGHASIQTTLKHYNQVNIGDLQAGMGKLSTRVG